MNVKIFLLVSVLATMSFPVVGMFRTRAYYEAMALRAGLIVHRDVKYSNTLRRKIRQNCSIEEIETWSSTQSEYPLLLELLSWPMDRNDSLKRLLDKGLSPQTYTSPRDLPIRRAIGSGNDEAAQLLLEHGVLITDVSREGSTLLMETVSRLYARGWLSHHYRFDGMGILHQLLAHKNGTQLINCKNMDGKSALGLAICGLSEAISEETKVSLHIVDLLVQHGENPSLAMQNDEVVAAIEKIEKLGYKSLVSHLHEQSAQFKKRCALNLCSLLAGGRKEEKENEELAYGPFPRDMALLIAEHRFDCEK